METKTVLEKLKEDYGVMEGNPEFIPKGGELLTLIGQQVIVVNYKREESGEWSNSINYGDIINIDDFDPLTISYSIKYKINDVIDKVRIIPEGFSFENPEESGKSIRFIPMSYHFKYQEKVKFYNLLDKNFDKMTTLSIDDLSNISKSKEKEKLLGYSYNISSIIKAKDGSILCFRITNLKLKHNKNKEYSITIYSDKGKYYTFLISSDDKSYLFNYKNEEIGELKIVDLSRIVKPE